MINNTTIQLKIRQDLNKISSNDSSNIECWQIVEAFNSFAVLWCRNVLRGATLDQQGDEQSTNRIDDLQILLKDTTKLQLKDFDGYQETVATLPADYMRWKRFKATATSGNCTRPMKIYLAQEANVDLFLQDKQRQPNFGWGETFGVIKGNKIQIYNDGKFTLSSLELVYYRLPVKIQIQGCKDPYSGIIPAVDTPCEFKDDICEIMIKGAAKQLAGDTDNNFQYQRGDKETKEDT